MAKKVCFFTNEPLEFIKKEQYSIQDINILKDLGYNVVVTNSFRKIPFHCDLYFSWWASGSILPLIKAKISNRPIIVIAGGNEAMLYNDSVDGTPGGYLASVWYKKVASRLSLKLGTRILVVSNFMVNDTIKLGAKKPIVVHNSVNTNKFNANSTKRSYITSIFNLEENVVKLKRGENFIRSIPYILKYYPKQKFVVIGRKLNYYEKFLELCKKLGIEKNVLFVGSVDNSEVPGWLQKSKVYVQISDTETFGLSIAEAMSCGTHVVVSKRGAIPEVVGDYGVYVDHNNPVSVARGILSVLHLNDEVYNEKSQDIRNHIIDNFSYQKRKEKISSIIKELL